MKVGVNAHGRELHELVKRPLQLMVHQAFNFERPRCEIDLRRSVRVEHGPLFRARLTGRDAFVAPRSEEHTSELQSQSNLVCRLLLEKKKKQNIEQVYNVHEISVYDT